MYTLDAYVLFVERCRLCGVKVHHCQLASQVTAITRLLLLC